jgi:hypothetical protein
MRRSDCFLPASREHRGEGTAVTKLLVRTGLVRAFGSGLWGFTPAGQRVRENIIHRVREGMRAAGAQAVQLPGLQHRQRWADSGRWGSFEGELFTLTNRDGREMCLAPSHEEGMVHLVDGLVRSYDDLPLLLYQVASKFRDDHARNGLIRCKEFTMKDAYSFHVDEASLADTYAAVREAYADILRHRRRTAAPEHPPAGHRRPRHRRVPLARHRLGLHRALPGRRRPRRLRGRGPRGRRRPPRAARPRGRPAVRRRPVGRRALRRGGPVGIPATVVVGNGYRDTGLVDVEFRDGETRQVDPDEVDAAVERFAAGH